MDAIKTYDSFDELKKDNYTQLTLQQLSEGVILTPSYEWAKIELSEGLMAKLERMLKKFCKGAVLSNCRGHYSKRVFVEKRGDDWELCYCAGQDYRSEIRRVNKELRYGV